MSRNGKARRAATGPAEGARLVDEILRDAHGDDEQLWAFRQAFEDHVETPCDGFVVGEPVSVVKFLYDGNVRRGLTARCRRSDGSEHLVAAADVVLPQRAAGSRYLAAYREWLGLDPLPAPGGVPGRKRQHKATESDLDLAKPVELVVLSVKESAARCRLLGTERLLTLRATRLWKVAPAEVVVVQPRRHWSYAGHPYLSGEIVGSRLDVKALQLIPLALQDAGTWDPAQEYWGEDGAEIEDWAKPIIRRGPRPAFEMERVLPGSDPHEPDSDAILNAIELEESGDPRGARAALMKLCEADLRCLDAHAHLGNFAFDRAPKEALRHYEAGVRIGELSLGNVTEFDGVLPWGLVDNRPFLRCLQGFGLCLWRLGRLDEAHALFDRMLWLNPSDNQGVRFLVGEVRAGRPWEDGQDRRRRG